MSLAKELDDEFNYNESQEKSFKYLLDLAKTLIVNIPEEHKRDSSHTVV